MVAIFYPYNSEAQRTKILPKKITPTDFFYKIILLYQKKPTYEKTNCTLMLLFRVRLQRSTGYKRNELKGNAFLVLGAVEVTYERILNEDWTWSFCFLCTEDDFETSLVYSLLSCLLW
jgi:hypothetical protein